MPKAPPPHSAKAIRNIVLKTFKKCRQAPDEPFEASSFLAFLTVENSLKALEKGDGHKRFYRFYDCLEDELQIFIGQQKIRKNWDFEEFCSYLERAVKGRKSGIRGAEYYNERMMGCAVVFTVMMIPFLALAFLAASAVVGEWFAAVALAIIVGPVAWRYFLKDYLRYRKISKSSKP